MLIIAMLLGLAPDDDWFIDPPLTTAAVDNQDIRIRPVFVDELDDMDVYSARGERLAAPNESSSTEVTNAMLPLVTRGLDIGQDRVAFSLERLRITGNRLVIRGVTEEDIEAMDDYREKAMNYRRVSNSDRLDLRVW